ncbi:MAG: HDOD domain-containing protein [Deltaproteobacteria bacterium]|nr:HDOD domain-containing protein [Deltaproteobacteria bacterium]
MTSERQRGTDCQRGLDRFAAPVLRVLLVDDDPRMLRAMLRVLRTSQPAWVVEGSDSGAATLAALEREPWDVLVSDIEMPEMDGMTLLREVRARFPEVGRIILSAWSTEARLQQAALLAHQFLWKPAGLDALVAAIRQVSVARALLADPALVRRFSNLDTFPPLPGTYQALQHVLEQPACSLQTVTGVVSRDPAVTAHVLRMASSGWFGRSSKTASLFKAVSLLGLQRVRAVVLGHGLIRAVEEALPDGFDVHQYQEHSIRVASYAQDICPDPRLREECFTAGLLHDIGWLLLHREGVLMPGAERAGGDACCEEHRRFGVSHGEVAAFLFSNWGFESSLVCAALFHHHPGLMGRTRFQPVDAVHVVEGILGPNALEQGCKVELDLEHLHRLGLHQELAGWERKLRG